MVGHLFLLIVHQLSKLLKENNKASRFTTIGRKCEAPTNK